MGMPDDILEDAIQTFHEELGALQAEGKSYDDEDAGNASVGRIKKKFESVGKIPVNKTKKMRFASLLVTGRIPLLTPSDEILAGRTLGLKISGSEQNVLVWLQSGLA